MPSILPNNNTGLYNTTGNTGPVIFNEYGNANVANYLPTYSGNISSANIGLTGIFTNNYYYANGAPVSFAGTYSNANVAAFLPIYSGNISGGNVTISGVFTGSGSGLTAIAGANVTGTVANATQAVSAVTAGTVTTAAQPNITSVGTLTVATVSGNVTAGGNISGAYILGNGSQLTGLPAQYGNANVAAFLPTYTGNLAGGNLSVTGVVSGNGSGLTAIPGANVTGTVSTAATVTTAAQPNITSVGTMVSLTATGNVTGGNLVTLGNVSGAYILGNGSQLTGLPESYSNANVASFLTTYTGNLSAGNISVAEDIVVAGDVTAGVFYGTFSGNISGNLVVPGSNTWVLYNNDGNAGSDSNFRFDSATDTMTVNGIGNIVAINATDITATGNILGGNVSGNGAGLASITGANVTGTVATATTAATANTVTNAAQANITSVGTLTSLSVTGNATVSGNVVASVVQASNSGGLALKNAGGTTQASMGAGGGDNFAINVSTNLNGTNAQIDISPTGTGHVHIKPTGTGAVEIAPTNPGTINNMVIGNATPLAANFTTVSTTGNVTAAGNVSGSYILGNGSALSSLTGANVTGTVANAAYATTAGSAATATTATTANTVTDAAQANITSVGTLTSLTVSGNVAGGNISTAGQIAATGNITASGNVQGAYLLGNAAFISGLNSFSTVNAAGQNLVATTASDTLTILAGTNIGISANTAIDTMVINNLYGNANVLAYVNDVVLPNYGGNLSPGNVQVNRDFTVMGNTFYVGQPGLGGTGLWGPWDSLAYITLDANNVAIGNGAGSNQQDRSISIGYNAGTQSNEDCIAIGAQAAELDQNDRAIAIGNLAGQSSQQYSAIAIGQQAGRYTQGVDSIAIGTAAGANTQSAYATAVGYNAGSISQGQQSTAIGYSAGYNDQGTAAVAMGSSAGLVAQGNAAVAIGYQAGYNNQGAGAIAIGTGAGNNAQAANSIVLNASSNLSSTLDAVNAGLYINPVRNDAANVAQTVYYNTSTKELTYAASVSPGGSPGGSNTQIQYNNAGSFGGAAVFSFNNATGNVAAGNIVIQANTTSTGAAQNIYTNSNQYFGNTATSPVLGRMLFGSGLSANVGGSGDFSNNTDIFQNMRGARMVLADRYQKTDNGIRSGGFINTQFVDISGSLGAANNNSRIAGVASDMFVGGGNIVSTSPLYLRNLGSVLSIGNNGNALVGNANVNVGSSVVGYMEVRPGSTLTHGIGFYPTPQNNAGNAASWTNYYCISPQTGGNAAITNFSVVHLQNASGNGWGVSSSVPPTNYYFLNNQDIRSESIVGPIRQYQDKTYLEATGSGTIAVDWDNGTTQVFNLTGNTTFTFQDAAVGTDNQRLVHTVNMIIYQDATGRTVTLPTPSTTYRYANAVSTVSSVANSVSQVQAQAIRVGGATQYLITVSPAFTG